MTTHKGHFRWFNEEKAAGKSQWTRVYLLVNLQERVLSIYQQKKDQSKEWKRVDVAHGSCKKGRSDDVKHVFVLTTNNGTEYVFRSEHKNKKKQWIDYLTQAATVEKKAEEKKAEEKKAAVVVERKAEEEPKKESEASSSEDSSSSDESSSSEDDNDDSQQKEADLKKDAPAAEEKKEEVKKEEEKKEEEKKEEAVAPVVVDTPKEAEKEKEKEEEEDDSSSSSSSSEDSSSSDEEGEEEPKKEEEKKVEEKPEEPKAIVSADEVPKNATADNKYPRLIHMQGKKKTDITYSHVAAIGASVNSSDVFILDNDKAVYTWLGASPNMWQKQASATITRAMDDERGSSVAISVISNAASSDAAKFWELLGGKPDTLADSSAAPEARAPVLYRLSDNSGSLSFTEVARGNPLGKRALLDDDDVFVADLGFHIFVWIGKKASREERDRAVGSALAYKKAHDRPECLHVERVMSGGENELLYSFFSA